MSFGQFFVGVSWIGVAIAIAGGSFIAGWLAVSGVYWGIFASCAVARLMFACWGAAVWCLGVGCEVCLGLAAGAPADWCR